MQRCACNGMAVATDRTGDVLTYTHMHARLPACMHVSAAEKSSSFRPSLPLTARLTDTCLSVPTFTHSFVHSDHTYHTPVQARKQASKQLSQRGGGLKSSRAREGVGSIHAMHLRQTDRQTDPHIHPSIHKRVDETS